MARTFVLALISLFSSFPAYGQDNQPNKNPLAVTAPSLQYEVGTFSAKSTWQSLECHKQVCQIKPINVRIVKKKTQHLDDALVPYSTLQTKEDVTALFANYRFKPGIVRTWHVASKYSVDATIFPHNASERVWSLPGSNGRVSLIGQSVTTKHPDGESYSYKYVLSDGITTQELFSINEETPNSLESIPVVHWVGDIDRDGKPDMLVSITNYNCAYDMRLYLSSKAQPGDFMGKTLYLDGFQAACGC